MSTYQHGKPQYDEDQQAEHLDQTLSNLDAIIDQARDYAWKSLEASKEYIPHPLSTIDARALIILCNLYEGLKPEVMDAEEQELLEEWLEDNDGQIVRITAELDDGVSINTVGEIGILDNDASAKKVRLHVGEGLSEDGDVLSKVVEFQYSEIIDVQALWTSHWSKHGYSGV